MGTGGVRTRGGGRGNYDENEHVDLEARRCTGRWAVKNKLTAEFEVLMEERKARAWKEDLHNGVVG